MWSSLKNVASMVADLAAIAGQEIQFQANNVSDVTEGFTSQLASKAADLRADYENSLEERSTPTKPEVVTEVPKDAVTIS